MSDRRTRREEAVASLLWWYREVVDPVSIGEGSTARNESRLFEMQRTYNRSFRELDRLLRVMRDDRPSQYWHVSERYLRSTRQPELVRFVGGRPQLRPHSAVVGEDGVVLDRGKRKGSVVTSEERLVERWNARVNAEKVRRGVAWLAVKFDHEPFLPMELYSPGSAAA